MSNEQPPRDDDQDNSDSSYDTGRAYSSVEISRRVKGSRLQHTEGARAIAERILAEVIQHERDTAARRAAEGDPNPYDLDPLEKVRDIADDYDRHKATGPEALSDLLDLLAEEVLELADVRALRTAANAAADAMGRLALDAREKGMSADEIAAESGYTASRITQFIREEKQRRANAAQ
ncbi:hypothetical protein [Streptomyces sp. BA2]|uniref:hypothetical protein n=1 Tax=Streptomyces sp. BA2 TaxID=436595 RepID=UPI0013290B35|nr:hypothetical protein [Streptomyces sp. BA2]MWA12579.1 hypothetical protein [Streptomyces sp. BA2]